MLSPATVNEGVNLLTEIATKYGDKKEAADGIALLAALTQPSDIENTTEQIKSLREATANDIFRDVEKAHAYAEQAVKTNPQSYKALYELATDYLGGEARMKRILTIKKPSSCLPMV
jgi:serine/threonine-protein kinase